MERNNKNKGISKANYKRKLDKIQEGKYEKRFSPLKNQVKGEDDIRLNKYLSNSGICSRREADDLIMGGLIMVNDKPILELGKKIKEGDIVKYDGRIINPEKKKYLVLNKPKGFVCSFDEMNPKYKDAYQLIKSHGKELLSSVGRLDRNSMGVLLFTNDRLLAEKLTHPKTKLKKIYHISLNKSLSPEDLKKIKEGVTLEKGYPIKLDSISLIEGKSRKELGIEVSSNKNKLIQKIFDHLGYGISKLDVTSFANINKKNIQRGEWRKLTQKEVNFLKML